MASSFEARPAYELNCAAGNNKGAATKMPVANNRHRTIASRARILAARLAMGLTRLLRFGAAGFLLFFRSISCAGPTLGMNSMPAHG
jgi:hypothetical protein